MRINHCYSYVMRCFFIIGIVLCVTACIENPEESAKRMLREAFSEENFLSIELDEFAERTGIELPNETLLHGYAYIAEQRPPGHYAKLMIETDAFVEWVHQIYPNGLESFDDDFRALVGENYGLWTPQDDLPLPTKTTSIANDNHKYKQVTLSLGYRELGPRWVLVWLVAY